MRWKGSGATSDSLIMNESELESELRRFAPAPHGAGLEARVAAELQTLVLPSRALVPTAGTIQRMEAARPSWWRAFLPGCAWASAGALAATAIVLALHFSPTTPAPLAQTTPALAEDESVFEPVDAQSEVVAADEAEIVFDAETGPAQVLRTSTLERYTWSNPATGALVEIELPREDIVLIPVAFQ
jgi:hypothetical protein